MSADNGSPALDIAITGGDTAQAGEWLALSLRLTRPTSYATAAVIKFVSSGDRDLQLDTDLLGGDVEIRPGESYTLTLPIRIAHPKIVDLSALALQVGTPGQHDELVPLPARRLSVQPSIAGEIKVRIESLCTYAQGTKAQITFLHEGRTHFDDLVIRLGPEAALIAGKGLIRRPSFHPGDQERIEVVLGGDRLEVELAGTANGQRAVARRTYPVPRVAARLERRFRFLEPRRLSLDHKVVFEAETQRPVEPVRAAYPLHGDERYNIVIRPQLSDVTDVNLHDIPGEIHVLKRETDRNQRAWTFLIDVTAKGRMSKPERLFYDVVTPDERLTGEIHLRLKPPRHSHLILATTLGIAVSIQGVGALAHLLLNPDYSVEDAFAHFNLASHYQVLFIFAIPFAWTVLTIADWLQYRWST